MNAEKLVRHFCIKIGYDIVKYKTTSHPLFRRRKILEDYGINVVLDVGANRGDYGKKLRSIGYRGRIISFEPLSSAFKELTMRAKGDGMWETVNCALGNIDGMTEINIAGNSQSSSILEMLPSHLKSLPESKYVGKEQVEIRRLDSVFEDFCSKENNIFLKMDTQGFERCIIEGAKSSLRCIDTIQVEMSLTPLYRDELLFNEMYQLLCQKKYLLIFIEQGFSDKKTGQVLQVDGIFHR